MIWAFHRRKLSQVSFSETGGPRLRPDVVEEEDAMDVGWS
jgi:hypothetical protein